MREIIVFAFPEAHVKNNKLNLFLTKFVGEFPKLLCTVVFSFVFLFI